MDPANRSLNFTLTQGKGRYQVCMPAFTVVKHLMEEAEKLTGVPCSSQKLIVGGKALTSLDHSKAISDCGIKDASKIMVLGKKYEMTSDPKYQQILIVEQKIVENEKKLKEVMKEVKDIEDGFLAKEHKPEALKGLTKRCKSCIEDFTQSLEALDGLQFEEHQNIVKNKRKSVIKTTNAYLDTADETLKRVEELCSNS